MFPILVFHLPMGRTLVLCHIALQILLPLTSALSLNQNFQPLRITVPSACAAAYSRQIPNCSANDFVTGFPCSDACLNGLNQVALQIKAACNGVEADSNTLLGVTFLGELASKLCPENNRIGSSTSSAKKSTTLAASSSTPAAESTPAIAASTSSTTSSPTLPVIPSSSASATSSLGDASQTPSQITSQTPSQITSQTPSQITSQTPSQSISQTTSQSTSATLPPQSVPKLSAAQQQILAMKKSGGGSPFDIVGYSEGNRITGGNSHMVWAVIFTVGIIARV